MTFDYLLIMRHAKSSWSDASLTDHERPLNKRGKHAARAVGKALTARGYAPNIIWSSDSKRTRETAMGLIRAIPGAQMVRYFSEFYHGSFIDVDTVCNREVLPEGNLMWLGHNPGWADMYGQFSGR